MKTQKIGKDNEVTIFYPKEKVILFQDMSTELSYKLDAIPRDRNSYFTTRYLNVLQKGDVDDSAKWSVADRIFAILQYGIQQNKDMKVKFNYTSPCRYCGKNHGFTFDYASLFKSYKASPKEWPEERWGDKVIRLKPMTGEFETLIEFHESQYWDEKLNEHPKNTIEYQNFQSELAEHNGNVFTEIQLLRISAHSGIDVEELKAIKSGEFEELLIIVQKHIKALNYGTQFWENENDHIANPGSIEYYHTCLTPDEEYMERSDPELLEQFKKGGLDAILVTVPFRAKNCA